MKIVASHMQGMQFLTFDPKSASRSGDRAKRASCHSYNERLM
jgi:hypothetical protein